jgi:NAD(P) transhydrogenase subunit alpha
VIIGITRELVAGEKRVSICPENIEALKASGINFWVEQGAGLSAGFNNSDYLAAGAEIIADRSSIFTKADIILQVQSFGANRQNAEQDLELLRPQQIVIGMMDPLAAPQAAQQIADSGATAVALELVPRISRAQSMDVLSSMATLAGYRSVLLGAEASPRILPMLMTAAGTLQPARVLIMGVGVAGLQACATAKRLGAVVEAYDVRPAAREQIISVGATPVELDLPTESSEGAGGYAKQQSEEFLRRQRELMTEVVARQDIVITTAAVPGAKSPILVTEDMLKAMKPGSVVVDMAAERGGNCELTKLGQTTIEYGVSILGPENMASEVAFHASQMYGKNMQTFLELILQDGQIDLNFDDEIIAGTVVAHKGAVTHPHIRKLLDLPPLETQQNSH